MTWRSRLLGCLVLCGCSGEANADLDSGQSVAGLDEDFRIDGYSEELVPIDDLLVGPEGEIILEQRQDSDVRFYDSTGVFLGTFGGAGEGPGELSGLYGIGFRMDTLWVWDQRLSKMSFVSQGRGLTRTFVLGRPIRATPSEFAEVADPNWVFPVPRGIRPDGDLVVELAVPAGIELPEPYANQVILGLVTPDGSLDGILVQVRHGGPIAYSTGTGGGTIPYPLRNAAHVAVSDDGNRIAGAVTSLQGGEADSLSVTAWDNDGGIIWSRSVPFERVALSSSVVDSVFALMSDLPPRFHDAFREQVQVPPAYPPLLGLIVGRDHSVWIEMVTPDGARSYRVLSDTGDSVGTLPMAEGSRIAAAQLDRIWTIERDEVGVESVVQYSVSWN